mgnify:CR=1 FL=1
MQEIHIFPDGRVIVKQEGTITQQEPYKDPLYTPYVLGICAGLAILCFAVYYLFFELKIQSYYTTAVAWLKNDGPLGVQG